MPGYFCIVWNAGSEAFVPLLVRAQEEMYIFMEYCDEGTLEEVSRLGLQEHVIRLYSKQITTAINVLHEHGIVHRDIKGERAVPSD